MHCRTARYSRDLYSLELKDIANEGQDVDVRGRKTRELLNYVSEVEEPWHHCILIPSRRWNPWLAMSEALWILAGRDDIKCLLPYNQHIGDYSDNGVTLFGAYGARIYFQIDDIIDRLRKDPSDRRAVIEIWRPGDLIAETKDPPCNTQLIFKLRDNKLHMTIINRSNDIHFGLFAVNLPTFGILQSYIAARLGVDMGYQTHFSNSLHFYTDDKRAREITSRMLGDFNQYPVYPEHERVFTDLTHIPSHSVFSEMCSDILDRETLRNPSKLPNFLTFAHFFLSSYSERQPFMWEGYEEYADWKLASWIWNDEVWSKKNND